MWDILKDSLPEIVRRNLSYLYQNQFYMLRG
nr:MAG TPA: hypothetical protein [Caudoviricetes sp.]